MSFFLGFLIAVAVGLTGVGGGSFTVPALVLIVGLTAGEAVGTAFVFAGVLRLIAAPFYVLGKNFHARYLWLLLIGAVPGLLLGTLVLRLLGNQGGTPVVIILLGIMLAVTSSVTFVPRAQNPGFAQKNSRWLPWLALPIGVEYGFSSAGAGALGSVLLLNYSEITTPQVIGTDLIFGLVLAAIGGAFHWKFGAINGLVLGQLLAGGVPGAACFRAKAKIGCRDDRHFRRGSTRVERHAHSAGESSHGGGLQGGGSTSVRKWRRTMGLPAPKQLSLTEC
jgi:uncharacterized membrane protein YfcA